MARLEPGRAVLVGEIANVLAHVIDGDTVDDGGDNGVVLKGGDEPAEVVDGLLRDGDGPEWGGGAWDQGGFPVAREEGRDRVGGRIVWDGHECRPEGGVVVDERDDIGCG